MQKFIEKKPLEVKEHFTQFIEILLLYQYSDIVELRARLGKILNNLIQMNFPISNKNQRNIFYFFFNNIRVENYQINLISSEFFLLLLENEEEFIKNNQLNNYDSFFNDINLIDKKKILEEKEKFQWICLIELFERNLKE